MTGIVGTTGADAAASAYATLAARVAALGAPPPFTPLAAAFAEGLAHRWPAGGYAITAKELPTFPGPHDASGGIDDRELAAFEAVLFGDARARKAKRKPEAAFGRPRWLRVGPYRGLADAVDDWLEDWLFARGEDAKTRRFYVEGDRFSPVPAAYEAAFRGAWIDAVAAAVPGDARATVVRAPSHPANDAWYDGAGWGDYGIALVIATGGGPTRAFHVAATTD